MRPFYQGVTILIHGIFASMVLLVLIDVASPTFNVQGVPALTGSQFSVVIVAVLTTSLALGVVMHTISRSVFHKQKQAWTLTVLASSAVRNRLAALGRVQPSPGGPTYADLADEDATNRVMKAAAFMHGMEFQVLVREPVVFDAIQIYRDQYRLARGFILPSAVLAFILPLWGPVAALDGAGFIGPLPIIRTQAFLVSVLAAAVCYVSFRERAFRYAAAKALAWVTVEAVSQSAHENDA